VILKAISGFPFGLRSRAFLASLLLLSPPSILLGIVTPYATRLKLANIETSGRVIGNLYAFSAIGSIFGTFLAGFYLIAWLGLTKILFLLSLILILFSIFGFGEKLSKSRTTLVALIFLASVGQHVNQGYAEAKGFIDLDTEYNRIIIKEDKTADQRPIRTMSIAGELNSAMFLKSNDLVLPYTEYYRLAKHFALKIESALMIGAGGYSYPKDFLASFPKATMDVVEIDPKITELARKYFNLKDNPRLTIFHEDGRTFLNGSKKTYDAIYVDAFSSFFAIPYELTTEESVRHIYRLLNDQGVVLVNIVSSLDGPKSKFLTAEYQTFREVFPQVYLFPTDDKNNATKTQSIMLVAMKSNDPPSLNSEDAELTHYLTHFWAGVLDKNAPILTDDFTPVDQYVAAMANERH
jgi:spermidine synthase